jgi:pimeloyl-ACP methyl ester carboxylesterase
LFGTSLGGIVTMLFGVTGDPRLAGFLLNDIGPIVSEAGLERIRTYVGAATSWANWDEAAAAMAVVHSDAYPEYGAAEWARMARQLCREQDGAIVSDYDPAIATLTQQPTPKLAEPWGFFEALKGLPGLLVYGALSNILEAPVAAEMAQRLPDLELVTLPRVGHPPTLEEPAAVAGIDRLLARIDARPLPGTSL